MRSKCGVWLPTCIFVLVILIVRQLHQPNKVTVSRKISQPPKFIPYSHAKTRTFHMVCLTQRNAKIPVDNCFKTWFANNKIFKGTCRLCHHPQKSITIYYNASESQPKENVGKLLGFQLDFKPMSQLPSDYRIITNQTAYFLGYEGSPHEPNNFAHFTKQMYFPLYWLIKSTNQLDKNAHNLAFYPRPYGLCHGDKVLYHNINQFQYFRDILYIKNKLELSARIDTPQPHKVCYKNAVFSSEFFTKEASEPIRYFKKTLDVTDAPCKPNILTILNRKSYRRILNIGDLIEVAKKLGYEAQEFSVEKLSLKQQAQQFHCSSVMVGVNGAGMQWAYFMKNNSGVIEIAWPDKEWHHHFTGSKDAVDPINELDVIRHLRAIQLNGKCQINPHAVNIYAKHIFFKDLNISYEDSMAIVQDKRNYGFRANSVMSVGKLCDVIVDKKTFEDALIKLRSM